MKVVAYYLTRGKSIDRLKPAVNLQYTVVAEFVDEEPTTGRFEWPVLKKAVRHARKVRAKLLITRLGKLKYSLPFLRTLEGVDFICRNNPLDKDSLADQIADTQEWAQQQANIMRDRAAELPRKWGFAGKDYRHRPECVAGVLLGSKRASEARRKRSVEAYQFLIPRVREMRKTMTWQAIVEVLNDEGYLTTIGTPFNHPTLIRLMQRADNGRS